MSCPFVCAETIVKEELSRLQYDQHTVVELDSLVEELHKALAADNQYTAERIYLDSQMKIVVYGSERAIELNEQLILLKNKQKQLSASIIDSLKVRDNLASNNYCHSALISRRCSSSR